MVCAESEGRDVMVPWQALVGGCRYYNERVNRAAFVLPQSGHEILEEGRNVLPLFGRAACVGAEEGNGGGEEGEEVAWERVCREAVYGVYCAESAERDQYAPSITSIKLHYINLTRQPAASSPTPKSSPPPSPTPSPFPSTSPPIPSPQMTSSLSSRTRTTRPSSTPSPRPKSTSL